MGGFSKTWCHMRKGYPSYIREAGVQDAWKAAPVAWESCWDMRRWVKEGWSLRFIFNYALALHGSYLNNKSAPLPEGPEVRAEVERFLRRLGYRLVLTELTHAAVARPGGKLALAMKWQNTGSAPCYRPYRLAYRLVPAGAGGPNVPAPNVAGPNVAVPNVAAPNVAAPNVAAPNVAAPNVAGPNVAAPNVAAPAGGASGVGGGRAGAAGDGGGGGAASAPGPAAARTLVGGVTVNRWLPGSVELFTKEFFAGEWDLPKGEVVAVADEVALPPDIPPGKYTLSVAVVGEDSPEPAIRLGIKGRQADGWYPLSEVEVRR
jgi:hypothetical protein